MLMPLPIYRRILPSEIVGGERRDDPRLAILLAPRRAEQSHMIQRTPSLPTSWGRGGAPRLAACDSSPSGRQGNRIWNCVASYPHPCPLPTRGRETPAPLSQLKSSKFAPYGARSKSPSPLWGGVRGGGYSTCDYPARAGERCRAPGSAFGRPEDRLREAARGCFG